MSCRRTKLEPSIMSSSRWRATGVTPTTPVCTTLEFMDDGRTRWVETQRRGGDVDDVDATLVQRSHPLQQFCRSSLFCDYEAVGRWLSGSASFREVMVRFPAPLHANVSLGLTLNPRPPLLTILAESQWLK